MKILSSLGIAILYVLYAPFRLTATVLGIILIPFTHTCEAIETIIDYLEKQ